MLRERLKAFWGKRDLNVASSRVQILYFVAFVGHSGLTSVARHSAHCPSRDQHHFLAQNRKFTSKSSKIWVTVTKKSYGLWGMAGLWVILRNEVRGRPKPMA